MGFAFVFNGFEVAFSQEALSGIYKALAGKR